MIHEPTKVRGKQWYREVYLRSNHWRTLRAQKLVVSPRCEKCFTDRRLDVHHLRYRNLYDVLVSDLMTLCRGCHDLEHATKDSSIRVPQHEFRRFTSRQKADYNREKKRLRKLAKKQAYRLKRAQFSKPLNTLDIDS